MSKANVKIIFLVILSFGAFVWAKNSNAEIIPGDRQITWQGNVGVEGGIPARTTQIDCTQAPYNVPTDGVSDCKPSISACLNGIASGQTAYVPAGTYILASTLVIPSNKTLRGAGMTSTILRASTILNFGMISIGKTLSGVGWWGGIDIQSGYTRGSDTLTFASRDAISTISVGDFILIDELNDITIPVTPIGLTGGHCDYCGRPGWDNPPGAGGARARGQSAKITGKSGAQLTITPLMFFTFSSGNSPQIAKWDERKDTYTGALTQYARVENLTLYNNGGDNIGLAMGTAANCWVKNIKIEKAGSRVLVLGDNAYRCEVRDSYFYDCNDHINSNQCYGTSLQIGATGNLVENNIYDRVSEGPMVTQGASGDVIAYNYMYETHRTINQDGFFWPDTWSHAAHPSFNLLEGNEMVGGNFDYYVGSGSHNVIFRNRILAKSQLGDSYYNMSSFQAVAAVMLDKNQHYHSVVGNVLGTAGWHTMYEAEGIDFPPTERKIYRTGYDAGSSDSSASGNDHAVFETLFRHMNYDYYNNSTKYCSDAGEPGCQGGDGSPVLPNSLYLPSKPSFFGNLPWPPIGTDLNPMAGVILAKARHEGQSYPYGASDITPPAPPMGLSVQ